MGQTKAIKTHLKFDNQAAKIVHAVSLAIAPFIFSDWVM